MERVEADRSRAWEDVLHHVESDLLDGSLSPGDRLPPERALAASLGVGRSSVREGIRVLEALGLVRTQPGSGPQSGAIIVSRPSGGMSQLMRLQVAARGFAVADLVKTRLVLESAVVRSLADMVAAEGVAADVVAADMVAADGADRAAATHPGGGASADLRPAIELLDTMDAARHAPADFLALDASFHLALAVASGNAVIASIMAGLRSSIEAYVLAGASALPSWEDTASRLRHEHRAIVDAIRAGDAGLAARLVDDHITGYYLETDLVPGEPGQAHP